MTIKQIVCGVALGLALLFSGYAATGIHDTYSQTSEIPYLVARVEKLENSVLNLQTTQSKNQKDIIETVEELKVTVDLLTRITTGYKAGASPDGN